MATTKVAYAHSQQNKQLQKLQMAYKRFYRYFPELFILNVDVSGISTLTSEISPEKREKYQEKLKSGTAQLTTKAQITVSCLENRSLSLQAQIRNFNNGAICSTIGMETPDGSTPNALVELKNGKILIGYSNRFMMLLDPIQNFRALSYEQMLLLVSTMFRYIGNLEEIVIHPEWYEIFKTLPQLIQDLFQHRIKLVEIDANPRKRKEFDYAQEDQQQTPRNGYGEYEEDLA